MYKRR